MKILIAGNGGREHALLWKLALGPSHALARLSSSLKQALAKRVRFG